MSPPQTPVVAEHIQANEHTRNGLHTAGAMDLMQCEALGAELERLAEALAIALHAFWLRTQAERGD